MKYVKKSHIIILMILVLFIGVLLLLGERASRTISVPTTSPFSLPSTLPDPIVRSEGEISPIEDTGGQQQKVPVGTLKSSESQLSYSEAVRLYSNTLLQFNEECQLSTKSRSYSLGTELMLDNRSPLSRTIRIGSVSLVLGPYDYGFVLLREKGTSVSVSCGSQNNIATLVVQ